MPPIRHVLKAAQKANWATPADQPDIDPPHEALMLKELLREAHRPGGPAKGRPADLQQRLAEAEKAAAALEEALRTKNRHGADDAAVLMQRSCTDCHAHYRDRARDRN